MSVHVIKDTKLQGLQALSQRLKRLNKRVLIGVPAGKSEEDGTSMALVAAVNEFGSADGKVPERSFLRAGLRHGFYAITRLNVASLHEVSQGRMTAEMALERTGMVAAGAVKKYIPVGEFVPNAPSTIKAKGSSKPLIDSGSLRQSITWVVEEGAL